MAIILMSAFVAGASSAQTGAGTDADTDGQSQDAASLDEEGRLMLEEGRRLVDAGRARDALPFYRQALDMAEVHLDASSPALGLLLHELGSVYRSAGEMESAERQIERALSVLGDALGALHVELLPTVADLAALKAQRGASAEAQTLYQRLVALLRLHRPRGDKEIVAALGQLALSLDRLGQTDDAESFYRQALEEIDGSPSANSIEAATVLNNLGALYVLQSRYTEAEALHRRAAELRRQLLGPSHWLVAFSLSDLAHVVEQLGRDAEALDLATRAAVVLAPYCQGLSAGTSGGTRNAQEVCLETEQLRRRLKGESTDAPAQEPAPQTVNMRPGGTVYRAQVLSREDPDLARAAMRQLRDRYDDLLRNVPAHIETIDLGEKGIWYRLQFGDFAGRSGARDLCQKLLDRGWNDCWVSEAGAAPSP